MDPIAQQLTAALRDRAFFLKHTRDGRGATAATVFLLLFMFVWAAATGFLWTQVDLGPGDDGSPVPMPPTLIIASVFTLFLIGMLLVLVGTPLRRRARARRRHDQFLNGGEVWWQADLGVIVDEDVGRSTQVPFLALLLPPTFPEEAARQAAVGIGQRIAVSSRTGFETISGALRDVPGDWLVDGSGVDDAGLRFSRLRPGRYVVLLPDGTVLAIRPSRGVCLDVCDIVMAQRVGRDFELPRLPQTFRWPWQFMAAGAFLVVFFLVIGGFIWSVEEEMASSFAFTRWLTRGFLAVLALVGFFVVTRLFGSTRVDAEGIHISRVFWRRHLPWRELRGFTAMIQTSESPGSRSGQRQIVAVDQSGRTFRLPGLWESSESDRRSKLTADTLAVLDVLRRTAREEDVAR